MIELREVTARRGFVVVTTGSDLAYTVGLTERGWPELVITHSPVIASALLDEIARRFFTDPTFTVTPPTFPWHDEETGSDHIFTAVDYNPRDPSLPLGFALHLYGDRLRAVRLDPLSCRCTLCERTVHVDHEGNIVTPERETPS